MQTETHSQVGERTQPRKLHFSHPAQRIVNLAEVIGGTPSVAAAKIVNSKFSDFRHILNYRDYLALRRFAKKAHRFYDVLWNLWSGATAQPIKGLKSI